MTASTASTARLILVLAAAGFSSTFAWRSVEPLVGVLARDLGSDAHTVALLSTAFALPYALIQPILGPVGDAVGKERVIAACLAV
ncbi:MFS transporter, partial [Methylobacterium sp. WL122]